jgi:hypothetical protein
VDCSVDVAVVVFVEIAFGFDDLAGFLGGGSVINVYEWVPVDLTLENWKVIAELLGV